MQFEMDRFVLVATMILFCGCRLTLSHLCDDFYVHRGSLTLASLRRFKGPPKIILFNPFTLPPNH